MSKNEIPRWLLSRSEEEKMSAEEKHSYYKKIREYCMSRSLTNTTIGATLIGPKLKGITGKICTKVCRLLSGADVEMVVDGLENIPEGQVIFASTHQGVLDGFVWIPDCPKHAIIFHGVETNKALLLAQVNTGLTLVSRDKNNVKNRINAKLDTISLLLKGHSIFICPEGTWNLSPNRLHLPFNYGFLDIAQKAGVSVVPMVIEYTYDSSDDKEKITHIHIRYGTPIAVGEADKLDEKLSEYEECISTMRWELIEEKGGFLRREISEQEYINYMRGNLRNLKMGKINIEQENKGIYSANSEFFVFHHINNVPWDEHGRLMGTDEEERLKCMRLLHGI